MTRELAEGRILAENIAGTYTNCIFWWGGMFICIQNAWINIEEAV